MTARVFIRVDRVVRAATEFVSRAANWAYGIHEAVWLGVLDRANLTRVVALQYDQSGRYLGDEHNLSGLFAWEAAVIEREFRDCASILVGAAGAGREVLAIAGRGTRVDAFDPSPELVAAAQKLLAARGIESNYLLAEPDRVPAQLGVYDGAIVGWGGYSHIPDSRARIGFLRELATHLRPGAAVFLSVWERGGQERKFRTVAGIARFIGRLGFAGSRVETGDSTTHGFAHYFTREELERELAAAGFRMDFYSDTPCGHAVARRDH